MKLKFESAKFNTPSLFDMGKALEKGLKENYQEVQVDVVDCPDLRQWSCPAEGISGNEKIIDVGGEPYMHDPKLIGADPPQGNASHGACPDGNGDPPNSK